MIRSKIVNSIKLFVWLVASLILIPISFLIFTAWELVDRKGSNEFWDEVYDPYDR